MFALIGLFGVRNVGSSLIRLIIIIHLHLVLFSFSNFLGQKMHNMVSYLEMYLILFEEFIFSFILRVCIQILKFHNKCLRDWNLSMLLVHKGKKHMLLYLPFPDGRDAPFSLSNMKTTTWMIHYDFECDCEVYRSPYMDGLKIVWSYITCSQRDYNHLAIMCMPKRWILRVVQLQLPNGDLWIVWTKLLVFMPIQRQPRPW
jgi:hypothetical protein